MSNKLLLNVELRPVLLQADLLKIQKQIQSSFQNIKLGGNIDPRMAQILRETEVLVEGLTKKTGHAESALHRFGRGMVGYFTRFASFTLAASGVFKVINSISKATDAAIEFDHRMIRLRQITGDTREQLKGLSNESFRLATTFGVGQEKILKAAETLAQAGYSAEQTKSMLQALAKADLSPTFENMEQTTDGLIATLNQFGIATTKSEEVLSKLNSVAAKYPVEAADLISAIQRTGGVFAQSKTSLDEFLALFTAVRSTTRETPETIAQGLKTIVTRIQRVKTSEFLERLGISGIRDASTREFVGAYKAIQILSAGITKFKKGSPELAAITEELGGIRQIGKVLPLLNHFKVAEAAYETSLSSGNSITKDAAIAQDSLAIQISKTQEELTKLVTTFLDNKAIKGFIKDTLELTRVLVQLASKLEPILPYLAIIAASRVLNAGAIVTRGALDTLRNVPDATKKLAGHASGGYIPGRSTKDDYPALLMRGEYVVSQKGVDAVGTGFLDRINRGEVPRFAKGTGRRKPYNKTAAVQRETEEAVNKITEDGWIVLPEDLLDDIRKAENEKVVNRHILQSLPMGNRVVSKPVQEFGTGIGAVQPILNTIADLPENAKQLVKRIQTLNSPTISTAAAYTDKKNFGRLEFNVSKPQGSTTTKHEVGHLVMQKGLDSGKDSFQEQIAELLKPRWQARIKKLKSSGILKKKAQELGKTEKELTDYITNNHEVFADFYSEQTKEIQQILGSTTDAKVGFARLQAASGGRPFEGKNTGIGVNKVSDLRISQYLGNAQAPASTNDIKANYLAIRKENPSLTVRQARDLARERAMASETDQRLLNNPSSSNPIKNLTNDELRNVRPLLLAKRKEEIEIGKELRESTKSHVLRGIVDKAKSLSSSLPTIALEQSEKGWLGLTKPRKFKPRFGRGLAIGATAALFASNTDFFQNSVDGIAGKGVGGSTAAGAIRGGLTGAATGSFLGPWGIAIGGMVSAFKGASDALKEFEENLTAKTLTDAINDAKEATTAPEKRRTAKYALGATISNLDAQMRPSAASVLFGGALFDEVAGTKKLRDNELVKTGFAELQPVLQEYIKSAVESGATSAEEINKKFGKQDLGNSEFVLQNIGVTTVDLFKALNLATGDSKKAIEQEINSRIANQKIIEANKQRLSVFGEQALITSKQLFQFSRVQKQLIDSLPDTKIRTLNSSESFIDNFSGLNSPGTSKFAKDANKLGSSREVALAYNQTYKALENALSNINPDATFQDFSRNLEDSLRTQLGDRFSVVIGSILEALGNEEKFNEFAQKLKKGIDEPLNQLLNESGLNQIPQKLQEVTQAFANFKGELLKNTQQLFGGAEGLSSGRLNLAQSNLSSRRQRDELLGIGTTAGLDNQLIQQNVIGSLGTASPENLAKIINNFDKLAQVTGDGRYVEASKYVVSALTKLGDVSSRTGDILTRINELERIRSARISLKESLITGDSSSRRQLLSNLSAARGFISTGGNEATFEKLTPRIQKAVVEGLRSYGDIPLYKGKTGNQLADNLLGGTDKEKDRLMSTLGSITTETERINTFLVTRMTSIQQDFIRQYTATNNDFLSRFGMIVSSVSKPRGFATGGLVGGVGNVDSVPAMLMPGEFVLNKRAVQSIGIGKLRKINQASMKRAMPDTAMIQKGKYADGGLVTGHITDVSGLDRFNNLFGLNIEKLNKVAEAIPHTISMNVNHRLEIIHNGAQVFETMEKSFVDLAQTLVSNEINKLIKTKFPDVGMLS